MEQRQITIVVAVIKNERGEVLLARRHQPQVAAAHGLWEFVGGGVEFGEAPEEALKREVSEEAGVEIKITRLLPKIFSERLLTENSDLHVLILTYECETTGGKLAAGLDQEIAELKFVPLKELKNYDAFKNVYKTAELL